MNKSLIIAAALLFQSNCMAQLRSKIEYRNNNSQNLLLKPSSNFLFIAGETFEDYVKVIGRDDSVNGHTKALPIVKNDSVVFLDYVPFKIFGDSMIKVQGPCLIRDYNLNTEQAAKRNIPWKYPEYTEIKHVYHDTSGRAYILHAFRNRKVDLRATELDKLKLLNYDVWVKNERQGHWLKYQHTMNRQFCSLMGISGCSILMLTLAGF